MHHIIEKNGFSTIVVVVIIHITGTTHGVNSSVYREKKNRIDLNWVDKYLYLFFHRLLKACSFIYIYETLITLAICTCWPEVTIKIIYVLYLGA